MVARHPVRDVLCVVSNYAFSVDADALKRTLSSSFETLLVDNSSPIAPQLADEVLPNQRYPGLWNAAVRLALHKNRTWLLFVASDVVVHDVAALSRSVHSVIEDSSIGIYAASLDSASRLAYPACFQKAEGGLRECFVCEGFFFLARLDILAAIYPIDIASNEYGWGIDALACYWAYRKGYKVVVDDRVTIHHPAAIHEIPIEIAHKQSQRYLPARAIEFVNWSNAESMKLRNGGLREGAQLAISRLKWRLPFNL